jgi:hypothetical protein
MDNTLGPGQPVMGEPMRHDAASSERRPAL